MIKYIIFDNDGVLNDTVSIHENALNKALGEISENYIICKTDKMFDNLPTKDKLNLLTEYKGLPEKFHSQIDEKKQEIVQKNPNNIQIDKLLQSILGTLRSKNYHLCVASNSRSNNVHKILDRKQIIDYFDFVITGDKITHSKPHPEIFRKCMDIWNCYPNETLVIEDHPTGWEAAWKAGCCLLKNPNTQYTTLERIKNAIKQFNSNSYTYGG